MPRSPAKRRWPGRGCASGCRQRERLFYRRREANVGKKAGNIAEWIQTRGADYAHMIILDADSTMDGNTVVRLAALMEANPRTGIIQTHIVPAGRETLFARALQFSTRMTGAVLAMGTSFWQMGEANYYGHNAILRVSAFAACCRLPVLSGPPPLGGEILSHDFVEAAYLRRGGWHCWMLPELRGSYEEVPTNLLDYAVRDRRWVQGNLQHARLIGERGLHWMSRLHLGMGIFAYLASPLWLLMLLLSSSLVVDHTLTGDVYFGPTRSLFPIWPQIRWPEIHGLLALTGVLLFGPKLLALALRLWSRRNARRFGGRASLIVSFLGEIALTTLLAPVMMLFHTTFVLRILAGNAVGWPAAAARRSRDALEGGAATPHPACPARCRCHGHAGISDALLSSLDPAGRRGPDPFDPDCRADQPSRCRRRGPSGRCLRHTRGGSLNENVKGSQRGCATLPSVKSGGKT